MNSDFTSGCGRFPGRGPEPRIPLPGGAMPPTKPVVTVNGARPDCHGNVQVTFPEFDAHLARRDDPHGTRALVPIVYAGNALPQAAGRYKDTDLFVLRGSGEVYRREAGEWRLIDLSGSAKPMSGESVRLDTENDLYDAVQKILEKMGATVE